jgi:uncharacterized membrane protein
MDARGWRVGVKRFVVLYLATLVVLLRLDLLFLGGFAKKIFEAEVGDMLGEVKLAPAMLFYLIYVIGVVVFVTGTDAATWRSALAYGALFGLVCYATFELTSAALLKHWSWRVVVLDLSWGAALTAISASAGLVITNWLVSRL